MGKHKPCAKAIITSQWTSCCIGLIIFQTEARRAVARNKRAFELGKAWHSRRTISLGKHTQVNRSFFAMQCRDEARVLISMCISPVAALRQYSSNYKKSVIWPSIT